MLMIIHYSPKAAKSTRATKRRVMMETNLAMTIRNLFSMYLCEVCEEISVRSTPIYSEMLVY